MERFARALCVAARTKSRSVGRKQLAVLALHGGEADAPPPAARALCAARRCRFARCHNQRASVDRAAATTVEHASPPNRPSKQHACLREICGRQNRSSMLDKSGRRASTRAFKRESAPKTQQHDLVLVHSNGLKQLKRVGKNEPFCFWVLYTFLAFIFAAKPPPHSAPKNEHIVRAHL